MNAHKCYIISANHRTISALDMAHSPGFFSFYESEGGPQVSPTFNKVIVTLYVTFGKTVCYKYFGPTVVS